MPVDFGGRHRRYRSCDLARGVRGANPNCATGLRASARRSAASPAVRRGFRAERLFATIERECARATSRRSRWVLPALRAEATTAWRRDRNGSPDPGNPGLTRTEPVDDRSPGNDLTIDVRDRYVGEAESSASPDHRRGCTQIAAPRGGDEIDIHADGRSRGGLGHDVVGPGCRHARGVDQCGYRPTMTVASLPVNGSASSARSLASSTSSMPR